MRHTPLPGGGNGSEGPVRQIHPAVIARILDERNGLGREGAGALELRPAPFRLFVGSRNLIRGEFLRQSDVRVIAEWLGKTEVPGVEPVVNPIEFLSAGAKTYVDHRGRIEDLDLSRLDLEGWNVGDPLVQLLHGS